MRGGDGLEGKVSVFQIIPSKAAKNEKHLLTIKKKKIPAVK